MTLAVYRSSDANALETMKAVRAELKELAKRHAERCAVSDHSMTPPNMSRQPFDEIVMTLGLDLLLVVSWSSFSCRTGARPWFPTVTIPVSLIGTFAVLLALGYNANTISLFALIMAIGLVVDDAIVVVENVYRVMHEERAGPQRPRPSRP